jgi:hypothetical protein
MMMRNGPHYKGERTVAIIRTDEQKCFFDRKETIIQLFLEAEYMEWILGRSLAGPRFSFNLYC